MNGGTCASSATDYSNNASTLTKHSSSSAKRDEVPAVENRLRQGNATHNIRNPPYQHLCPSLNLSLSSSSAHSMSPLCPSPSLRIFPSPPLLSPPPPPPYCCFSLLICSTKHIPSHFSRNPPTFQCVSRFKLLLGISPHTYTAHKHTPLSPCPSPVYRRPVYPRSAHLHLRPVRSFEHNRSAANASRLSRRRPPAQLHLRPERNPK